ncbi:hypothetical protein E1B28_002416 [Marasmius oreades]|uniref:Uncharacterized protein n=1 Tax=Marasmius oreades TaxID=181124 RepID=A0A9P7UNY0_9AGAR|nr:uncharacterized protein E1B28_002416 [Marasmius oreades]KAG7086464.1 hypothetical protein E1B28_002416 [Marasmius oreades]
MSKRVLYLLISMLILGFIVSAAPIPAKKAVAGRSLKQLKLKRGDRSPLKRDDPNLPKPSGYPTRRDDAYPPQPSKSYRK